MFNRAAAKIGVDLRWVHLSGRPDSFLASHAVDLWPLLTITEERQKLYHMSQPWLFNTFCLLRLQNTATAPARERIAHWTNPVNTKTAIKLFPAALRIALPSREAVMVSVCRGDSDGGLLETRVLDSLLLARPRGCEDAMLRKQSLPAAFPLGIASVKTSARYADAIHDQITAMARSGELGRIFGKWGSVSANEMNSVIAMNEAKHKSRLAYWGILTLIVAGGMILWQFLRMRSAFRLARAEYLERKRADRTCNAILDGAGEGICGLDVAGRMTFVNRAAATLLGYEPADLEGREFKQLHDSSQLKNTLLRADGSAFPVEFLSTPLVEEGVDAGSVIIFKDITTRQQAEMLDHDRNAVLEMLALNEPLDVIFEAITLLTERQVPGLCCAIMIYRQNRLRVGSAPLLPVALRRELDELPDGAAAGHAGHGLAWSWSHPILSGSNEALGAVALYGNVPAAPESDQHRCLLQVACRLARLAIEQTRLTQQLHHQAHHDSLTGFPNRLLFEERLAQALASSRKRRSSALLYVDLDRFKQINDTLSHHVGDLYLCEVAQRLSAVLPADATLARLGGDEFGIILPSIETPAEAERIANALLHAMAQPFSLEGHSLFGTASVGITISSRKGENAAELQSCADQAMYRAKSLGRNRYQFYSADMSRNAIAQREMDHLLREALAQDRFLLYYQPQCHANGSRTGLEALIRLNHPERGLIPPDKFIPVAEENGLIVPIGAWVLHEVCRQMDCWREQGLPPVPVAINVSAAQLSHGDFSSEVAARLSEFNLDPSMLRIELTESMIMGNFDGSLQQMNRLRALGVQLSIDDFGTGYSSLSYLHKLPISTIKIDQSFVRGMDSEVSTRPLVEAIVAAARSLKCNIIAEGVETDAQRRSLALMGCEIMQGFFFSRPLPASAIHEVLHVAA
ncbi:MAG: EAL domain-containing protein [Acidobacteriota bacterium]|nr:EAL domain-containing protein [Acidobacteriota bacterium]